ncbi:MAG: hypothetical protein ACK4NO_01820 [Glycocaulis sp.]
MIRILVAAAGLAAIAAAAPSEAQSLGSGDYQRCAVYRPDGSFAGYSNACLEAQRAAIRRYSNQHSGNQGRRHSPAPAPSYGYAGYGQTVFPCPSWANNGYGYRSTILTGAGNVIQYGTFNSTVNGQPCTPSPNVFLRGIN